MKQKTKRNAVSIAIGIILGIPLTIYGMNNQEEQTTMPTEVLEAYIPVDVTEATTEILMATEEETTVILQEEAPEAETEEIIKYTPEDHELLAHLIMGEAGCDLNSDETLYLVGAVVMNRVNSDRYPNTVKEVIYQPGQYACTMDGNIEKEPTERCYHIAEAILTEGTDDVPKDVVYQAEFVQGSGIYKEIDGMYFCYEE